MQDPAGVTDDDVRLLEEAVRERTRRLAAALDDARRLRLEVAAEHVRAERATERAARTAAERDEARRALDRLRRFGPIRALLGMRRFERRVAWRSRSALGGSRPLPIPAGERRPRASPAEEAALRRRLLAGLPGGAPTTGPHVTIVVLNRDGEHHLRRLIPALVTTAYGNLDLIVVDNGSTDGSVRYLRNVALPFAVDIVQNAENQSFSAANNAAVRQARGELVLLLNNDVVPLEPSWLGYLVDALATTGAVAAGARLVIPRREGPASGDPGDLADLELQHVGIALRWVGGMPRPRNVGGPDAADPSLLAMRDVPASTAACLLVRRTAFLAVGGFDEAYVYGYEDVDLAMRWRDAGERIVVDGRAVLWHDESATRRKQADRSALERQRLNLATFNGRWGVRLFRAALDEALDGRRFLLGRAPAFAAVGTSGSADVASIEAGLARLGWDVAPAPGPAQGRAADEDEATLLLVGDPTIDLRGQAHRAVSIAWVRDDPRAWTAAPWFDEFDLVLAADLELASAVTASSAKRAVAFDPPTPEHFVAAVRAWADARRAAILVQARDWEEAPISGDYHFARALQRQLERRSIPTTVHLRPAWTQGVSTRDDLLVHLWGRYPIGRRPGQTSILWILYHPELVADEMLDDYDLVLVASDRFAAELALRTGRPVYAVHQATDPERFRPGVAGPAHELLFVGNSRGERRRILHDLVGTRHELAVYGRGWDPDLLDPQYLRGDGVPNAALAGYYGAATIVLNDHWRDAGTLGFINNRLYDALASGAFVISDHVEGIGAEFDDGIVTYQDSPELLRLVERYLADRAARTERARRGRGAVLARHTFSHRADEILRLIDGVRP